MYSRSAVFTYNYSFAGLQRLCNFTRHDHGGAHAITSDAAVLPVKLIHLYFWLLKTENNHFMYWIIIWIYFTDIRTRKFGIWFTWNFKQKEFVRVKAVSLKRWADNALFLHHVHLQVFHWRLLLETSFQEFSNTSYEGSAQIQTNTDGHHGIGSVFKKGVLQGVYVDKSCFSILRVWRKELGMGINLSSITIT